MKEKLLLFGGTTEAREIAESGLPMICCVATEYGAEVLHEAPGLAASRRNTARRCFTKRLASTFGRGGSTRRGWRR